MDGVVRTFRRSGVPSLPSDRRPSAFIWIPAVLLSVVSLTAQTPAGPQSPSAAASQAPALRLFARYVEIDAVVRDKNGRFIPGLTADDFEVFENDKKKVTLIDFPPVATRL